jgi:hypothetical protein
MKNRYHYQKKGSDLVTMNHIVFYQCNKDGNLVAGNVNCNFIHEPPTIEDIRSLEKDISERFCDGNTALITGWKTIQTEDDLEKSRFNDCINVTLYGKEIRPGQMIVTEEEQGSCIYQVEFGTYSLGSMQHHIGWYLKLDSKEEGYTGNAPSIRSLMDLVSGSEIQSWEIQK